jgi:hypothetical protein
MLFIYIYNLSMILIFSYQDYKKNIVFSPEYRKLYFQIQYKSINKVARDSVTAASGHVAGHVDVY